MRGHCHNCGHRLGLKTPVWWWRLKFCSPACKIQYRSRWWRDWRRRWLQRWQVVLDRPEHHRRT